MKVIKTCVELMGQFCEKMNITGKLMKRFLKKRFILHGKFHQGVRALQI
jgi:hypothetical protein